MRAFARLGVFVGRAPAAGVEAYILKMLCAGVADRDFADRHAQSAHQLQRIVVGAVGGPESGHRDADDARAVEVQEIEGPGRHEQCERRVQAARNPDDGLFGAGVNHPLRKSVRLYPENLLAAFAAVGFVLGYERHRVDVAVERHAAKPLGNLHFDHGVLRGPFVRAERGVAAAFELQPLDVHVGDDQLFVGREARGFVQNAAVFGDDGVAGEHEVGGRFAEARRAVDIGRNRASRLLGHQLPQVGVFADRFGRCREVEDHLRAVERQLRRGRCGGPEVLADLDAELRAVDFEREVGAEVGLLPRDGDMLVGNPGARREPAVFVELPVVGDIGFGNHAQHFALREDHGAVVERRPVAQGSACDQREGEFARGAHQAFQRLVGRVEQRLLQQEIAAGVGRDAQFGERHDLDAPPGGLLGHRRHPFGVVVAVGDPHVRNGRRYLEKTEIVHRLRDF